MDEPVDLAAVHRRISMRNRRRAGVRVGFAGAGVAALVGGLFIVREHGSGPAANGQAAAGPVASTTAQAETAGLPDCDVVLTELRTANSTPVTKVAKDIPTGSSSSRDDFPGVDFKGMVTIVAIDGQQLTFRVDDPKNPPPTTRVATLDTATVWTDGQAALDPPPSLHAGEQLGLATIPDNAGVEHVAFVDVTASAPDDKPAPDKNLTGQADTSTAGPKVSVVDSTIADPGATVSPQPTNKSGGTITAVDAASITVTLDAQSGPTGTVAIDVADTPFSAGPTRCAPGPLRVGQQAGIAYHVDNTGNVITDDVILMP